MASNPTIVLAKLDSNELMKSIDDLVNSVGDKTQKMATQFEKSINIMNDAMKNFAVTQKVSVDLMKEAWKEMSASFAAMVKAQEGEKSGGGKGKPKTYADNTIGALEQSIRLRQKERREMELGTEELRQQNNVIAQQKSLLKSETRGRMSMKEVLGMDESSLDAIRQKLSALRMVRVDPKNAEQVKRLGDEYARLSIRQTEMMGKNSLLYNSNNALARSFNYIRNRIIYAFTVTAMMNFLKDLYQVRGEYELLERSLGVLINSFERGSQVFRELIEMALKSPFTLMELAGAAKQLTAYNFTANEVVDTTRRLADISAALGVPMERLTYNLGQIKAQTVLTARDARDFANAGLPIVKSLAEYYTEIEGKIVSTGEVYDRMSKKMVSYTDVMSVLAKMTDEGGKFFDFQAKQAETLKVQMANLKLAWNNMLNEIGGSNQSLLSAPLKIMKALAENWATFDRVVWSVIYSLGALKALQFIAAWLMPMQKYTAAATIQLVKMGAAAEKLGVALKALALNPWNWVMVGTLAIIDFTHALYQAHEATVALNEEIRKGAQEASQSNIDYLGNKGNRATRDLAKQNKLSAEQGEKAWESIEEQINTSAASARKLLGELWKIDDVNQRVAKGFDYIESIQKSQAALQDLRDTGIKVSQDIGWGLSEGLASDLKDYYEQLEKGREYMKNWLKFGITDVYSEYLDRQHISQGAGGDARTEFEEELEKTAESINNFIQAHKITDPLQITEILERAKAIIKAKNPEIKGEMAQIFDVSLDMRMAELTNGAVDKNASLWEMFMERLKHNSSSAFQDITSDIYKKGAKLTKKQQEAVDSNLEYFKNTMPWYYNAMKKMVEDSSQLVINIGVKFGIQKLTDFQEEVNKRIAAAAKKSKVLDFGNDSMLPTQNDDLSSWVKTQQDAIKKLKAENEKYRKDDTEWSRKKIEKNEKEINQRTNLLELFKQSVEEEKKSKGGSTKKDEFADAIKKEIDTIKEARKQLEEYRKIMSNTEAIVKMQGAYDKTLKLLDKKLGGFGAYGLGSQDLSSKDLRDIQAYYQTLMQVAQARNSAKAIEALDKAIVSLDADISKLDNKRIVESLNSELGKLKEEYELAVALDADPELGDVFSSYFGIDKEKLPHDFEQAAKLAQERINKVLQENGYTGTAVDIRKLLDKAAFEQWAKENGLIVDNEFRKAIDAIRKYLHDTQVNEIKQQEQSWKKLLEKYAEYEYKKSQIQKTAEKERKVAQAKGAGQDVIDAINNREKRDLAKLDFEEFQKTNEWITATGDLVGLTDRALKGLIKTLNEYKKNAKDLDDKQIKRINNAIKSLYRELRKGGPFEYIKSLLDEAADRLENVPPHVKAAMEEIEHIRDAARDEERELTREEKERIKALKKTTSPYDEFGKVNIKELTKGFNSAIGTIKEAASVLGDFFGAMSGDKYRNAMKDIQDLIGVFEKAGKAAETGAKIGGAWGAAIGAVIGFATGLIQMFNQLDQEIVNKAIEGSQAKAQKYQNQIDRLKLSIDELSDAQERLNRVMGYGLSMDMKDNYKQQLLLLKAQKRETERQIELEKSRLGKYYDEKAIADLEGQLVSLDGTIAELERSIKNTVSEITDDLLGISRGSWADELTKSLIDSFRQGEKYMDVFEKSWDDMINNMIATVVSEKVVGFAMEKYLLKPLDSAIDEIESGAHAEKARLEEFKKRVEQGILTSQNMNESGVYDEYVQNAIKQLGLWEAYQNSQYKRVIKEITYPGRDGQWRTTTQEMTEIDREGRKKFFEQYGETIKNYILGGIDSLIDDAALQESTAWITAVKDIVTNTDIKDKVKDSVGLLDDILADFGVKFGDQKESELSALQQGIQSISEDTAGSIEAYLNGISQQVYLHSTLLTQIRDVMVTFDPEVSMGIQSQMLLQLQQSYQVQMSIESILQGVLNPSGRAFAVEIIS